MTEPQEYDIEDLDSLTRDQLGEIDPMHRSPRCHEQVGRTVISTLAIWKWSDWHREQGHLWQQRPGKPTRCVICRRPVLPWYRRWRDRALIRWAIMRGALRRWLP